jgi:hypothetical protein
LQEKRRRKLIFSPKKAARAKPVSSEILVYISKNANSSIKEKTPFFATELVLSD